MLILASNVGCDQISKSIARERLSYNQDVPVIGNSLILTKVENTGAFLSMGTTLPHMIKFILLTIIPVIALCFAFTFLIVKRNLPRLFAVGLACIVGGGIGNIYDRVLYGSVTDFLHIDLVWFRTGIFNMADVSILLGTAILTWHTVTVREKGTLS